MEGIKALLAEQLHRCATKTVMAKLLQAAWADTSGSSQIRDAQLVIQVAGQPLEQNLKGICGLRNELNTRGGESIKEIALKRNGQ